MYIDRRIIAGMALAISTGSAAVFKASIELRKLDTQIANLMPGAEIITSSSLAPALKARGQ